MKEMFVYILTNKNNTTFYTGGTSDLIRRVYEHKNKILPGFSSRYELFKLLYFEKIYGEEQAIRREKYLKKCYSKTKIKLINQLNPLWKDLYPELSGDSYF